MSTLPHAKSPRRRPSIRHAAIESLERRTLLTAVSLSSPSSSPVGVNPVSIATGDFNQDGKLDLVVANQGVLNISNGNTIGLLFSNGNGTFGPEQTIIVGTAPSAVAVGDLNGDGHLDIVVANNLSNSVSVLLGNGNGTFQAATTLGGLSEPDAIAIADVNNDGRPDIVVANSGNSTVTVEFNIGGSFTPGAGLNVGQDPTSVAVGDLNGDGSLDIVTANKIDSTLSVLFGNGVAGTFKTAQSFASGSDSGSGATSVAIADVSGDGKPDLVSVDGSNGQLSIILGNGNGTFAAQQLFTVRNNYYTEPSTVSVADLNGDGIPDVAVACSYLPAVVGGGGSGDLAILLGNGNGTFGNEQDLNSTGNNSPNAAVVADFNGDNKPDVAVATGFTGGGRVDAYLNETNGNFGGPFATLNNGVLSVVGTTGNDTISFSDNGSTILAIRNGQPSGAFQVSQVTSLNVSAGAGDDSVSLAGLPIPGLVSGAGGNDIVAGGAMNDTLRGGAGNDTLGGAGGNDVIQGGADNDSLKGGAGNDSIVGGAGNDVIHGGTGADTMAAGAGVDTINGNNGLDSIIGGAGQDLLLGGPGADTILGAINAGSGPDSIDGGTGADSIRRGAGDQILNPDPSDTVVVV